MEHEIDGQEVDAVGGDEENETGQVYYREEQERGRYDGESVSRHGPAEFTWFL